MCIHVNVSHTQPSLRLTLFRKVATQKRRQHSMPVHSIFEEITQNNMNLQAARDTDLRHTLNDIDTSNGRIDTSTRCKTTRKLSTILGYTQHYPIRMKIMYVSLSVIPIEMVHSTVTQYPFVIDNIILAFWLNSNKSR